jgi:hypothetical protein
VPAEGRTHLLGIDVRLQREDVKLQVCREGS